MTVRSIMGVFGQSRESRFLLVEYSSDRLNILEGESYWKIKKILCDQRRADGIHGSSDRVEEISRLERVRT